MRPSIRVIAFLFLAVFVLFVLISLSRGADPQMVERGLKPIYGEFLKHCKIDKEIPGDVQRTDIIKDEDGETTWYLIVQYKVGYAKNVYIQMEIKYGESLKTITFDGIKRSGLTEADEWKGYCNGRILTWIGLSVTDAPFDCEYPGDTWSEGIKLFREKYRGQE